MSSTDPVRDGATVVITHRIREGAHAKYAGWLEEIGQACRSYPGHLDWQIIRPIRGLSGSYTVVIRFDSVENLRHWMESDQRKQLIAKAAPLMVEDDEYSIHSGLDFWFMPHGTRAKIPVRWKQFLITWSAIYPLALGVPLLVSPVLGACGVPDIRALTALFTTGLIVLLMVYVVMPRYTRWVRRWLFAD